MFEGFDDAAKAATQNPFYFLNIYRHDDGWRHERPASS